MSKLTKKRVKSARVSTWIESQEESELMHYVSNFDRVQDEEPLVIGVENYNNRTFNFSTSNH